jgi:hypothetical protein
MPLYSILFSKLFAAYKTLGAALANGPEYDGRGRPDRR